MIRGLVLAVACSSAVGGPLSGLLASLTSHETNATCAEHHACAASAATSFGAFFPAADHAASHFLPDISSDSITGGHSHAPPVDSHLDQFDGQSLLSSRRPRIFVSFEKK